MQPVRVREKDPRDLFPGVIQGVRPLSEADAPGVLWVTEGDTVTVAFAGTNSLGRHVHGAADLVLPDDGRGG